MPRNKQASTQPELTPERREVQRIAALLRNAPLRLNEYYAVGEQVRRLARDASVARRGSNWRERLAELVGCSPSTLNKAMQFCEAYEPRDLVLLEQMGLGWSRLTIALGVGDREARHQLLHRAKEENWDDRQLQRTVQQLRGKRRGGGRPRRTPEGVGLLPDLFELTRLAELWNDFNAQVWAKGQAKYAAELARLPQEARDGLLHQVVLASEQVRLLQKQGGDALQGLNELAHQLLNLEGPPVGEPRWRRARE
jgi:hypothetical protein